MASSEDYHDNAQQCVRMAQVARDEQSRAQWLGLAQAWVRLGELAAKKDIEWGSEELVVKDGRLASRWSPPST
jgi:hypothetical protein